jgi:ABC-2 type transport system ATP-binding protein
MLQRVGLAQSIINDPEIVFLDEPMSGLDPIGRREVRDLIAALRREGKTVFMCSHILSDIEILCDRVAILRGGKLSQVGRLDDLRQQSPGSNQVEIIVSGATRESIAAALPTEAALSIAETAGGLRIEVPDQTYVDPVLAALRKANGTLVSVQPIRQSLEELFLNK